jgi:hypothetical protein
MNKKKVKELMEQILKYCDQCYNPNWQPKSFKEFIKLGNICREAIKEINKSDWISVEDGLPPYDESVLVTNKETPEIVLKTSRTKCKGWNTDENGFLCAIAFNITHWKPIEKLEE